MSKLMNIGKSTLMSLGLIAVALSCAKEETTSTITPSTNVPDSVDNTPPTQNPGSGEKLATDPICTIALSFPNTNTTTQNEANLGQLIEQPSWITGDARVPAPSQIEPPTQVCLFVDTSGSKPKASLRLEYEDKAGRVQYTLKDQPDYDLTTSTTPPAIKKNLAGDSVYYAPSYYVNLAEDNFEIFFMPTWGFLQIKGKKEADGFFHAKIYFIKFLNAPIEPYYLSYSGGATDTAKIKACTGDDGGASNAKIIHPDRPAQSPVDCARAHRIIRSAFQGPWDAALGVFKSHNEYTGNSFDYRVEIVRQYTNEDPAALADFLTASGQQTKVLGSIKFQASQVWSGTAP